MSTAGAVTAGWLHGDHGAGSRLGRRRAWLLAVALVVVAAGLGRVGIGMALAPSAGAPEVLHPRLAASFHDAAAGIDGRAPAAWQASQRGGGIVLESPDHAALVEIAAVGTPAQAPSALADSVAAIRRGYPRAVVLGSAAERLDGLAARTAALSVGNGAGLALRVVVAAAAGRHHTYLLDTFVATDAPRATVVDAQAVVGALQLHG